MNHLHTVIIIKVLMLSIAINEWHTIIKNYIMITIDALFEMKFYIDVYFAIINSVYN